MYSLVNLTINLKILALFTYIQYNITNCRNIYNNRTI